MRLCSSTTSPPHPPTRTQHTAHTHTPPPPPPRHHHEHTKTHTAQDISDEFNKTISVLYVSLQSRTLQQYDKAPHLRQLYLRLDFNGYISKRRMTFFHAARAAAQQGVPGAAARGVAGGGGGAAAGQQAWRQGAA